MTRKSGSRFSERIMPKQKLSAFLLKLHAPPFQNPERRRFLFAQFRPALLTATAKTLMAQNNPLMIRARHWIFLLVLPMFRLSIIGA
jgi:hypothetical protein